MSAIDHDYIYLQPPCCADEDVGRLWCEDPDPTDCDDGKHWTKYVRSDIYEAMRRRVAELNSICGRFSNIAYNIHQLDRPVSQSDKQALKDLQVEYDELQRANQIEGGKSNGEASNG